ncbi:MAG: hypothetical protein IPI67_24445 [Myxococcales bacterium]|nr:hypothetical protein [Myxococcales bacterium]
MSSRKQFGRAREMATAALAIMDYPAGRLTLSNASSLEAIELLLTNGDAKQAERLLDDAREAFRGSVEEELGRGLLAVKRKDKAAARAHFERVLVLAPENAMAKEALAQLDSK